MQKICAGVRHLHEHRIIHRDLKPEVQRACLVVTCSIVVHSLLCELQNILLVSTDLDSTDVKVLSQILAPALTLVVCLGC